MKRIDASAQSVSRALSIALNGAERFIIALGFSFFGFWFTKPAICEERCD